MKASGADAVIAEVPVLFYSFTVGWIAVAPDGALSFRYDDEWLETGGAFPLSLTIPRQGGAFDSRTVSPWIANLLPEEDQLRLLSRSLGLDQSDSLAVLMQIGGDTAGALSFGLTDPAREPGYILLSEFYGADDEAVALERHFDDLGRRPFLAGEDGVRLSLAGGQKKTVLAVLDADGVPVHRLPAPGDRLAIPRNGAPSSIILKPDNAALPGIVENEAYCLTLAAAVGIDAAQTTIVSSSRRTALCSLRFDRRVARSGRIVRVHQEDFAQANGLPPGRKYEIGTVPGLPLVELLATGRHLPSVDALALIDQVIFNILVANTDAHAKNYALVYPLGEGARLAPIYDVSTVLPWDHVNQFHAQKLAGKKRKPGDMAGRHWDTIAVGQGYRSADIRLRVQGLVDGFVAQRREATEKVAAMTGASAGHIEQAADLIETNALRIAGRLNER